MRKWSLITAILLALSAWVVAQSSSAPPATHDSQQSTSQQPDAQQQQKEATGANHNAQTIEGCVTRGATGYTLTDNSGKTYQLSGDTSQLAAEDGHWDRVTGTQAGGAAGAAASAGAPPTITVTKVKVLQTTCPTK